MKLKFTTSVCALFIIFASWMVSSAQDAPKPTPKPVSSSFRGETYSYKLSDRDFANTPSWKIEDGEPPLSIQRAGEIARQSLPRFVQSAELWKIRRINLTNMTDDKWYYAIYFNCFGTQCRNLPERSFMSIVKMDGTIIEPKRIVEQ